MGDGHDREQEAFRRDEETRKERDFRDRDVERSRRDVYPQRSDPRGSVSGPSNAQPTSAETSRRPSDSSYTAGSSRTLREGDRTPRMPYPNERDPFGPRPTSPPPQAPQVPAFGSIAARPTPPDQEKQVKRAQYADDGSSAASSRSTSVHITKEPPNAPRAQMFSNLPAQTKADQPPDRRAVDAYAGLSGKDFPLPTQSAPWRKENVHTQQALSRLHIDEQVPPQRTEPHNSAAAAVQASNDPGRATSPVRIPTGPRAHRSISSARTAPSSVIRAPPAKPSIMQRAPRTSNLTWVRPGLPQHTPRGPSIMNTVPTKRDAVGEERPRGMQHRRDTSDPKTMQWPGVIGDPRRDISESVLRDDQGAMTVSKDIFAKAEPIDDAISPQVDKEMIENNAAESAAMLRQPSESDDTSSEDDILNEADFMQGERLFDREMQVLDLKRPPTPRNHPVLLELLEECDALAAAAEEKVKNGGDEEQADDSFAQPLTLGLPSPKAEDSERSFLEDGPQKSTFVDKVRRRTPPIESLPFLVHGPPTPFSDMEVLQEEPKQQEFMRARILEDLLEEHEHWESQMEDLKVQYAELYRPWRMQVEDIEDQKKTENASALDSPSSAPSALIPPAAALEGRRIGRNISQLELDRVMEESKRSADEDQERRNREAQASEYNPDKEAEIPAMLKPTEREANIFADINRQIDTESALEVFAIEPRPDDFTPDEHEIFVDRYLSHAKKFGLIADALPHRDYQDCIQHYYNTKRLYQYKGPEKALSRFKRGKRTRGGPGRGKSSALMPLYDGGAELDGPAAVTDTGRPRRAAAPTFGEAMEAENAALAVTPVRRTAAVPKVDANGEATPEKPISRRGRGGGRGSTRTRGAKTPAPLLAAAPDPSPHKAERGGGRGRSKEPKMEIEARPEDYQGAQLLASLQNGHAPVQVMSQPEAWGYTSQMAFDGSSDVLRQQPIMPEGPTPQYTQMPPAKDAHTATSSYWSVPEQTDFERYIQYYGTNFMSIANELKTKTHTMVRETATFITFALAHTILFRSKITISAKWIKKGTKKSRTGRLKLIRKSKLERIWGRLLSLPPYRNDVTTPPLM